LCHREGFSYTHAAQQLEWPRATLRGRLRRARALLRQRLTKRGYRSLESLMAPVAAPRLWALPPGLAARALRVVSTPPGVLAVDEAARSAAALATQVMRRMAAVRAMTVCFVLACVGVGTVAATGRLPAEPGSGAAEPPPERSREPEQGTVRRGIAA